MAPLPTIPNAVRVGLNWSASAGVKPYNVFHVITDTDDMAQLATDLGTAFNTNQDGMFLAVGENFSFATVTLTPLDGATAGVEYPLGHVITGGGSGAIIPSSAALVSLRSITRGPRGRGRLYLGPVSEGEVDNGKVNNNGAMTTAWQAFDEDLAATSSLASLGIASYKHAEISGASSIFVENALATQRRRQDQLR